MSAVASDGRSSNPTAVSSVRDQGSLTSRYDDTRSFTEELAAPLSPEDQTVQSMPDVSPTKWHRAHTSWFFETFVLRPHLPGYRLYHPEYPYLFNSYYEAAGPRYARARRGCVSRPGVTEVADYRSHVDDHMRRLLASNDDERVLSLTELGIHHEQQHQELLLMDVKHVLSQSPLDPAYAVPDLAGRELSDPGGPVGAGGWVSHNGGVVLLGHRDGGFAFDNEGPAHEVLLRPFAVADRLVTCGEWLQFIDDGGYRTAGLWLSDGWAAVQTGGWDAPLYWEHDSEGWSVFTLAGRRRVNPHEPVCHVSYYEADAFATWAGARLPTEFEWEASASHWPVEGQLRNASDVHPAPRPGPYMYGQTWAWTSSAYLPYPGFRPAEGAVGEYNGKFMVNQQVLRGGSCATPEGHIRLTYRNFFPPSARWPFTGVRLAHDL